MKDPLPISLVAEHVFCPRGAWLAHVAGAFQANEFTVEGELLHTRVHAGGSSERGGKRQWRKVPLGSLRLGVAGYADLVEDAGQHLVVVEYKRGTVRERRSDMIQVCLQALCLEEMTGRDVPQGVIFYAASRRRIAVSLDPSLRAEARNAVHALREDLAQRTPPKAEQGPRCRGCALSVACLAGIDERLRHFDWREWIR